MVAFILGYGVKGYTAGQRGLWGVRKSADIGRRSVQKLRQHNDAYFQVSSVF